MTVERFFDNEILEAKKCLSKFRKITIGIAKKYEMSEQDFEEYISNSKNFSRQDWEKLSFFRESINKNIKMGISSEDVKNMISYVVCMEKKTKPKQYLRRNWDKV